MSCHPAAVRMMLRPDAAEAVDAYLDPFFLFVGNLADCGSVSAKIGPVVQGTPKS